MCECSLVQLLQICSKLDCIYSGVFFNYKILCSVALHAEYFLHLAMLEQSGHQESEACEVNRYKWLLELEML